MHKYKLCEAEECLDLTCQYHCEHDFDVDEGYTCLLCGAEGDLGTLIDAAEYRMDPER